MSNIDGHDDHPVHVRAEHRDKPGLTARTGYADGMIEHDAVIGKILFDKRILAVQPRDNRRPSA